MHFQRSAAEVTLQDRMKESSTMSHKYFHTTVQQNMFKMCQKVVSQDSCELRLKKERE